MTPLTAKGPGSKQILETRMPVLPNAVYSIAKPPLSLRSFSVSLFW